MALKSEQKQDILQNYQRGASDTGSPEVQVALLSARIEDLSGHFKAHAHDNHSRQGLLRMVNRRRKLLDYLKTRHTERYRELIARLGLRK
jgi:small subunit ribosomal protein S15